MSYGILGFISMFHILYDKVRKNTRKIIYRLIIYGTLIGMAYGIYWLWGVFL